MMAYLSNLDVLWLIGVCPYSKLVEAYNWYLEAFQKEAGQEHIIDKILSYSQNHPQPVYYSFTLKLSHP